MGRRKVSFPLLYIGEEIHDRAVDALARYTVEELRTEAREHVGPGSWQRKRETVEALAEQATPELLARWEREAPDYALNQKERRRRLLAEVLTVGSTDGLRKLRERIAEELSHE